MASSQLKETLEESQSMEGYPRAYCAYHPQNLVLNFCRNPNCLMPLCQECIKLHQQEHYANGTYAQFDTIDDVQKEVSSNLEQLKMKYLKHKAKQNDYSTKLQSHDVVLYEQLKLARQRVNEVLDKFFSALHQEIIGKQYTCKEKQEQKLNEQYKLINERQYEIENTLKKLQGEHFLKYIIEFLSSTAHMDEKNFEKDSDATLSIFNMQLMDIMVDESKLSEIRKNLCSYITVDNASLYQGSLQKQQLQQLVSQQSEQQVQPQQQQYQQQQQTNSQFLQYPIQSFSMMSQPTLQTSNIQPVAPQSMGYSSINYRHSSMSPTKAIHTSTMPAQSFIQPNLHKMISARQPTLEKMKKHQKQRSKGIGISQQKPFYPNTTMYSSLKYITK